MKRKSNVPRSFPSAMNLGGSRRPEARTLNSEGTVGQYTKKEQPLEFQITNVWTAGEERRGRKAAQSPTAGGGSGGIFTTRNIFSSGSPAAGSVTPRLPRSPRLFSSQRSRSLSQSGTEGRYTSNAAQGMALQLLVPLNISIIHYTEVHFFIRKIYNVSGFLCSCSFLFKIQLFSASVLISSSNIGTPKTCLVS